MSDQDRFVSQSIEEMLVALAAGVREAQEALSESRPFDAFGRALPTYHIPYLDFEVAARMETQQQSDGRPIMRVLLGKAATRTTSGSNELSSKVSGRFVAIPPGEGLPLPQLGIQVTRQGTQPLRIAIRLGNSAGEQLAGRQVELNIDAQASRRLTSVNGGALDTPRTGTQLTDAVLLTDEEGKAETTMRLDAGEDQRTIFVVSARAGTAIANASVPVKE